MPPIDAQCQGSIGQHSTFNNTSVSEGLKLNETLLEYQLDRGMITLGQLVSRLAVQWEPGAMVMLASYQVLYVQLHDPEKTNIAMQTKRYPFVRSCKTILSETIQANHLSALPEPSRLLLLP